MLMLIRVLIPNEDRRNVSVAGALVCVTDGVHQQVIYSILNLIPIDASTMV